MKKRGKLILSIVLFITLNICAYYLSLGSVRLCAKIFAEPKPWMWEAAYVSHSPNAKCYHYSDHCNSLVNTSYQIDIVTVSEAEDDLGRCACKLCIEESRKHSYDKAVWYLYTPMLILLIGTLALIEKFTKKYTLRNPIIKKYGQGRKSTS